MKKKLTAEQKAVIENMQRLLDRVKELEDDADEVPVPNNREDYLDRNLRKR